MGLNGLAFALRRRHCFDIGSPPAIIIARHWTTYYSVVLVVAVMSRGYPLAAEIFKSTMHRDANRYSLEDF